MGLLSVIRRQKRKDKELRALVLGLDNAGKSSLVQAWCSEQGGSGSMSDIAPTTGFEIRTVAFGGHVLNLWDVGGQRTLRPFWYHYFDGLDAIVWVVDLASAGRLAEAFAELRSVVADGRLGGAYLLVLLNKADLVLGSDPVVSDPGDAANAADAAARDTKEQVAATKKAVAAELGLAGLEPGKWKVLECSAYSGLNVRQALTWLTETQHERLSSPV